MYRFFSIIFLLFLSNVSQARLLDEIDALSPEEAMLLQQKLSAKQMEPIPESLFTRMAFTFTVGITHTDPDDFKNSLDSAHDVDRFDYLRSYTAAVLWRMSDQIYLGLEAKVSEREVDKEIRTNVFETVAVKGIGYYLTCAYRFVLSERNYVVPMIGVGFLQAEQLKTKSDDNAQSSFLFEYQGSALSGKFALSWIYKVNQIVGLGIDGGYSLGKVENVYRSGVTEIASPSALDFSGPFLGMRISFNIR